MENTTAEPVEKKSGNSEFWDILKFAFLALIIVIPLRMFVAQPFRVSGDSMIPTFEDKDYLIVDELSYRFEEPSRGDVVIIHPPSDNRVFYIKRLIGLPGETIKIDTGVITIKNTANPDGFVLSEPYIAKSGNNHLERTLGPDEYFVMGDNRPASSDSRSWGTIPKDHIAGRPFLRLYPFSQIGVFPGEYSVY